ncbi:Hypothetical_protein [Hexamita inflata]|uniref:Hypothetical_protein n=1 Tax=Hexamita inflata TaxID=28002 RepID=A0AA86UQL7_9EUKA|nr:Hypothetical protein HINF_LOCUS48361 [Hexamita inflata]
MELPFQKILGQRSRWSEIIFAISGINTSNVTSRLTVYNSKYQTIQYIEKYFQIVHSINQNNLSWTCAEINCSLFKRNLTHSFEYDFVPFTAKFIFSEDSDQRKLFTTSKYYKIGKYCGSVLLAIVLIVVALKFVKTNQVVRQYKGYAKIKKPTQDQIRDKLYFKIIKLNQ